MRAGLLVLAAALALAGETGAAAPPDEGTARRIVGTGSSAMPAWTPDGSRIVFHARRKDDQQNGFATRNVWSVGADGSCEKKLTGGTKDEYHASLSPDGKKLLFVSELNGSRDIWLADADGQNPVPLTDDPGTEDQPAWAPAGRPGGLILGARVVGERDRVLPVGVREPDVTRAVQLRHEEELLAVRGEARVILVLGAAGELLLARAVGADAPDVAHGEALLLVVLAARMEEEPAAVGRPGRHGARAGADDPARRPLVRRGGGPCLPGERQRRGQHEEPTPHAARLARPAGFAKPPRRQSPGDRRAKCA